LQKRGEWSFLGCGGEAVGLDRGTRCEAMCAVCCGESTTLAGQACVFACGKTILAATLPPWGATYTNPKLSPLGDSFGFVFYIS